MRPAIVIALVTVALLAFGGRPPARAQAPAPPIVVKDVTVEGHRRVQEAVILGRVRTAPGATFNPALLSEDIKNVFALGFFDDVRTRVVEFEGGVRVVFLVNERPFIRDVDFAGNRKVATATLQEKIDVKLGSVYNPVEVQRAAEVLRAHYEEEGYFESAVTPEVEHFADGDVRVLFRIAEGRTVGLDRIAIVGNQGLPAKRIREAMATQEREWFIFRGKVQRGKMEEDIERILALYGDHGYIQARVDSYDISLDRERARATITIAVTEGPQFRVGEMTLAGVTLFPLAEIERQFALRPGDVFSRSRLRDTVRAILDLYSTIGRASADVAPRTQNVAAPPVVNVTLDVVEGPETYVERINIAGNVRSEDKILRREIPMVEGDLFTLQKLNLARQRLVNLGYFDAVTATTQAGSDPSRIVVSFEVTERPTGIFSIGGGFSSADGLIGTIDLAQNNFLGRGYQASIRIRAGADVQQGIISFTDPWFLDRPLSAGFDLFKIKRDYTEYDIDSTGATLRVGKPFWDFWRVNLGYRISQDEISNVADSADPAVKDEEGTSLTSQVTLSLFRDSRDNVTTPTRGGTFGITGDFAGLGGDNRFFKVVAVATHFRPIWYGHILALRGEVGYLTGWGGADTPLFERFYLGGPNSVRGFKFRKLSPKDDAGNRIGGTSEVLGTVEYIIPLPFNLRLAAFFDAGNAYGFGTDFLSSVRISPGAGVRWISPFGPIRVDYGLNIDPRKGEDFGALHFSVGSPF